MKKVFCLLLTLTILCGTVVPAFAEDEKVPKGYTPIRTAQELDNIRSNLSGKYILMNDINLGEYENWTPIGTEKLPFTGIIEGGFYKISNLRINDIGEDEYAGLFGYIKNAEIKRITIDGTINLISKKADSGSLCAYADTCRIYQCVSFINTSLISADNLVRLCSGGIVGEAHNSTVEQCANYGNISLISNYYSGDMYSRSLAGGIAGYWNGNILNCHNNGSISIKESSRIAEVGGLVGRFVDGLIKTSFNKGRVEAESSAADPFFEVNALIGAYEIFDLDNEGESTDHVINCYYLESVGTDYFGISISENGFKEKQYFKGFDFEKIWIFLSDKDAPELIFENNIQTIKKYSVQIKTGQETKIETNGEKIILIDSDDDKIASVTEDSIKGNSPGITEIRITLDNKTQLQYNVTVRPSIIYWLMDFIDTLVHFFYYTFGAIRNV